MARRLEVAAFLVVSAYILHVAFRERPRALGDAGEYFLVAESLFGHGTPELRGEDLAALSRAWSKGRLVGTTAPPLRHYVQGRDGRAYALHFWAYPLACLPAKAVLAALGQNELKALPVTNALLLVGTLSRLLFASTLEACERRALAALLATSPVLAFVRWPHPEVFSCVFVVLALAFHREDRGASAVLCSAVASLQNPPLVLFSLALAALHRRRPGAPAALLVAAGPPAFSLVTLGVLNPLVRGSFDPGAVSLGKALELFFDPNLGLLPHTPVALGLALAWPLRRPTRDRLRGVLGWTSLVVAMALACTLTTNWNHGTSGPSRYAIWLMPFVFAAVAREMADDRRGGRSAQALLAVAVVAQAGLLAARGGARSPMDYTRHTPAARLLLDRWPRLYAPSHEIFADRTLGREQAPTGPVVYRSEGRCRKALAQKRHLGELREACGPPAHLPDVPALRAARGRNAWFYVDY